MSIELKNKTTGSRLLVISIPVIDTPPPFYTMSDAINAPLKAGQTVNIDGVLYDVVERNK